MSEPLYHCFWVNPYGYKSEYAAHADLASVLALVKRSNSEDSDVSNLRVVYGELLQFEPATYVESYRVKQV